MGGVFDFLKSKILSKPGRGVVGLNIDRCITSEINTTSREKTIIISDENSMINYKTIK